MAGVTYDMEGRLLRFYAVPAQLDGDAAAPAPDWSPLFAEARLDPTTLRAAAPRWVPPFYADARAAWEGPWPGRPDITVRVEAASHRGKPVSFEVVWPWTRPDRMEKYAWPAGKLFRQALWITLSLLLVGAAAFMARRNIVLGRGDRRGAFRVALLLAGTGMLSWALGAHHVADWNAQSGLVAPRGGPRRPPGRVRLALLPRGRAVCASAAPVDPRVLDPLPRGRARRPGGGPRRARRDRLGRARVLPGTSPAGAAPRPRPAASRPDGWLPGSASRGGPAARFRARSRERGGPVRHGGDAALRPRPARPAARRPRRRGDRRGPARAGGGRGRRSRRGSRWRSRRSGTSPGSCCC